MEYSKAHQLRGKEKRPPSPLKRRKPLQARKGLSMPTGGGRIVNHLTRRLSGTSGDSVRLTPTVKGAAQLKRIGKRGKRLLAGDRAITEAFREMECLCGCSQAPDPCHLRTRADESTRHAPWNLIPLHRVAHTWLDQTAAGVQCRATLFEMAQAKGERLTHAEFWPVFDAYGGYITTRRTRP